MNILVCVKQVPESTGIGLKNADSLARTFVGQVINPADESALELALQLREKSRRHCFCGITMGRQSAERVLREIAARGADALYLLNDPAFAGADTLATALALHAAIHKLGPFDLILCGRRTTDGETGASRPRVSCFTGHSSDNQCG